MAELILFLSVCTAGGCNCGRKITDVGAAFGDSGIPDAGVCDGEPDGAACMLWWEPCVSDAVCEAGECRSAKAEAEVPGQLRWDAGLSEVSGPQTVDGVGNSTFVADFPLADGGISYQAIYAFDTCGKLLWVNDACMFGGVMSDGTELVAWGLTFETSGPPTIEHLFGLDPATGAALWETLPDPLIAQQDAGFSGEFGFGNPAMSNAGLISLPVETDELGTEILSLDHHGNPAWLTRLLLEGGDAPVVDVDGRIYAAGGYQGRSGAFVAVLWSGSASGALLLDAETTTSTFGPLAVGADFVTSEGFGELRPDGGTIYTFARPPQVGEPYCLGGQIVDVTGTVFEDIATDGGTVPTVVALSPTGEVSWQWQAEGMQSLVLSDDDTLFSVTNGYCNRTSPNEKQVLSALNAATGMVVWQVELSDNLSGFPYVTLPSLALTPNATLLTTDESNIYGVFAGQERPSTTAPWSRDRGGNDNRACASPP